MNTIFNSLLKSYSLKPWHSYLPSMLYSYVKKSNRVKDCIMNTT